MPAIFEKIDKIKPAYDITYKVVMFICKILLIADIAITSMSVAGRYIPFIPDPAWSEEVVLTCMSYMAVLSAALAIRRGAHIRMTALDPYLPKTLVKILDIICLLYTSDAADDCSGSVFTENSCENSGYHCRSGSADPGCYYDYRRLEICVRHRFKRYLCKYAEGIQILDVLPGSAGRRCYADF